MNDAPWVEARPCIGVLLTQGVPSMVYFGAPRPLFIRSTHISLGGSGASLNLDAAASCGVNPNIILVETLFKQNFTN